MSYREVTPGKKYAVRWREFDVTTGATVHRKTTVTGTERDAILLDAKLNEQAQFGLTPSAGRMPFDELVADVFRRRSKTKGWQPGTLLEYDYQYGRALAPFFGNVPIERITRAMVEDFVAWMVATNPETSKPRIGHELARKCLKLLKMILNCALDWEYVPRNVADRVPLPPPPDTPEVRPFTPYEVEAMRAHFIDAGRPRDALILSIGCYQGLRPPTELFALTAGHVRERTLLIEQVVRKDFRMEGERAVKFGSVRPATKNRQARAVDLHKSVAQELAEYRMLIGRPEPSDLLLPMRGGAPISPSAYGNWRRKVFNPAAESIGRPDATPYTMRHTCASILWWSTRDELYCARQLGHTPDVFRRTYRHVIDELEGQPQVPVDTLINRARRAVRKQAAKAAAAS